MKKTLIAIAALVATGAFAQSTVTLSGLVDMGIKNVSNVATDAAKTSVGGGNNSRIAFSATEDLGGGMKAMANLQMRLDSATGNTESAGARPLFQGESRVGLAGRLGTVMLGRGLTALQLPNGGNSDPWGVSTVAGSVYAAGFATDYAAGGEGRIDGGMWYTAPTMYGLTLSTSYSPKTVATTAGSGWSGKSTSVNVLYSKAALNVGLGKERNRAGDTLTQFYGNYDFGAVKMLASYANTQGGTVGARAGVAFAAAASAIPTGGATSQVAADGRINTVTVGFAAPVSAATTLRGGYSRWNGNGAANQLNDNKIGLGVKHDLSKRTFVYTDYATQSRNNNSAAVASPATNNSKVNSFDFGVSHSF